MGPHKMHGLYVRTTQYYNNHDVFICFWSLTSHNRQLHAKDCFQWAGFCRIAQVLAPLQLRTSISSWVCLDRFHQIQKIIQQARQLVSNVWTWIRAFRARASLCNSRIPRWSGNRFEVFLAWLDFLSFGDTSFYTEKEKIPSYTHVYLDSTHISHQAQ